MAMSSVNRRAFLVALMVLVAMCFPAIAAAQAAALPASGADSRLWITAGGGFTSQKGDCTTCEGDPVYRKSGTVLIDVGARANKQVDAAVELFWVPSKTRDGHDIRSTYLMGIGQYRPLKNRGFFLKGGMGVAFVRNWVFDLTNDIEPAFTTNAMAVTYGAGWEFRSKGRFGVQIFGSHNILALGDLTLTGGTLVENVLGNHWTAGASVVIR
jgi:hypothetical protein